MHSTKEVAPEFGMEVAPDRSIPEAIYPQYGPYKGYDISSQWPSSTLPESKIAGLRRATFWLVVVLCAVIALALGLGTGLGLGLRNNNVNNTSAEAGSGPVSSVVTSATTGTSTSATATTSSASSTTSTTSTAATTTTSLVDSGCPGINGTTAMKSTQSYIFYCSSDLTGNDQASLVTSSLDECLTLCDSMNWTQDRKDVGSVWNEEGVIGQTAGTCWCKGGSNIQVTSKAGIVVASALP
ncbi:hypothetical protein F4804DRAFT_306513 [Jackrogersella minutella]|nr:hypothetical protein F4804DRAFT_306513 [Jackrogersella minutella]